MSLLEDVRREEALAAENKKAAAERLRERFANEQRRASDEAAERVTAARNEAQERVAAASEQAAAQASRTQAEQQREAAAWGFAGGVRLPEAVWLIIAGV